MKKKVVMYSSNSKHRSADSNCVVFPKWSTLWNKLGEQYPDYEIYLVLQLSGRYFLDIADGELVSEPDKVHLVQMEMDDKLEEFVERIVDLNPDVAIAMPGPVSGIDWNGLRDSAIAEELNARGIKTIHMPLETAEICFDKWLTHTFLEKNGFNVAKAVYSHHELFFAGADDPRYTGNVYQETVLHKVKQLPFPVIIKGTTGSASSGIYIAETYEDARSYLLSEKNSEDLIIEEKLSGIDFSTEIHGVKGNYNVLPPFLLTNKTGIIEPLGFTTLKFGPIRNEKYHVNELISELTRLAELLELNGNNNLDLMLCGDKWYIIEINARWSGTTTLTTCSEGRSPYAIYLQQYAGPDRDYRKTEDLKIACNFKMQGVSGEMLEDLSKQDGVDSVIQFEVVNKDGSKFLFNDVVIGGFDTLGEMAECLSALQKKYPEEILPEVVEIVNEKIAEL